MSHPFGNDRFRFGSAAFATEKDIKAAGLFRRSPHAIFLGFSGGKPLWYDGEGGLLLIAGARSGKLRDILAYTICSGICSSESLLLMDCKAEMSAISADQTPDRKHCYYWNPLALHGLPQHRVNPVAFLHAGSPTLISDIKVFVDGFMPRSGAASAAYFELNGRRYAEAIILAVVERDGVLTLPNLYRVITAIAEGGRAWRDFAWVMYSSGIELCRSVEAEIAAAREDSSGGFKGIIGELQKAVTCLSDPVLQESLQPPYTFDLSNLCARDQPVQFYMMAPPEMIEPWAPVIKAFFTSAMILKSRAPQAPRQTWILDECAQLKGFDLVEKMFTYGAGIGIRPYAVFQHVNQMDALSPNARRIIPASASVQSYFGIRQWETARLVSDMLGAETLDFDDLVAQGRASSGSAAALGAVLKGGDPFEAALGLDQQRFESLHRHKQRRMLRTPDEVLNMRSDRQFIFADGLPGAVYAERAPYWRQRFMAGRFLPNPFHPPLDRVRIKKGFGMRWRPVVTEPVPPEFADYPQYQDGQWSYVRR
ncbi:MAG: type IV secretory system conjugative DNA transfer family protein [Pseudomonadota bacterium]